MVLLEISNQEISACYCVPGYICSCDEVKNRPGSGKRNSKCSDPETKEAKVSKLVKNRLDPALAHPHLLSKIRKQPCCVTGNCMNRLYGGISSINSTRPDLYGWDGIPNEGYGTKLFDAVDCARKHVYHTGQIAARAELKNLIQRDISTKQVGDIRYKFYHRGVLGNAPAVPIGITVRNS